MRRRYRIAPVVERRESAEQGVQSVVPVGVAASRGRADSEQPAERAVMRRWTARVPGESAGLEQRAIRAVSMRVALAEPTLRMAEPTLVALVEPTLVALVEPVVQVEPTLELTLRTAVTEAAPPKVTRRSARGSTGIAVTSPGLTTVANPAVSRRAARAPERQSAREPNAWGRVARRSLRAFAARQGTKPAVAESRCPRARF
jgi:hypothetical protein